MADVKRPMLFGVGVAAVALVSAGLAVWSLLRVGPVERAQTRIEQRVIHDERPPSQRQLLQAVLRALAVCHANRACAAALEQAKRGRLPAGGAAGAPGASVVPQPGTPQTGGQGGAPSGSGPGASQPGGTTAPPSATQPPSGGAPSSQPQSQPQPGPQPQPQPPVALPGPLKPVGQVVCGLAPRLCR